MHNYTCTTFVTNGYTCITPGLVFNTPCTRPGNFTGTKYLIGNVNTVLMITTHFVTFHFRQPAGTVVFHLCVLNTCRPVLPGSVKGDTAPSNWPGAV